jgi:hypothetical protein
MDCDTGHCLVVAKVRERLVVSKQATHMERFNLKELNKVEGKEISDRFAAPESLDNDVDINRA